MIVKFESKSQRVKGLAFHPTRPWLLASLLTGQIQLWDYRIQTQLDTYNEHQGPVRAIHFHPTQSLFVSGGDDYQIKVWNYKQRKCLFSLKEHLDYIRTVQFHHELPWILSASDDQTIRIWNWQNRCQLAILTGHSHYVMCAQFHPEQNLIVSCSLDQTLRIWDFTAIKKKFQSSEYKNRTQEVFGNEIEVIAVCEGHERGVNWCTFHPTQSYIVSAADDKKIKVWKYFENKAWEVDSLYGHNGNVSCVCFHPKLDLIISNAEDKTTRVWDFNKRTQIDQYKKEHDRFWICTIHPENMLIATGSDSGFTILSLFKDKMPYNMIDQDKYLVYSYRQQIKKYDLRSKNSEMLFNYDESTNSQASKGIQNLMQESITCILKNPYENSQYQFIFGVQNKDTNQIKYYFMKYDQAGFQKGKENMQQFTAYGCSFVSKNKFVKINKQKQIELVSVEQLNTTMVLPNLHDVDKVFEGGIGKIIVYSTDFLQLYDVSQKKSVNSVQYSSEYSNLKQIIWNKNHSVVALVCKKIIHLFTKNFVKITSFSEKFNIKSMVWTNENIVLYSTINHLKYGLLNGETGIIKCTDQIFRIFQLQDKNLSVIDANGNIQIITVNVDDFLLKHALYERNYDKTKFYMNNMKQIGQSTTAYLYKKNYSGLALNMVDDPKAKFSLAIDSGNLEVAYKICQELKDKDCFQKLAEEALRQGNHQLVEVCYSNLKEYDKLSFLFLLTGKYEKLEKMLGIAQNRGDNISRFHNSLYTGNVEERIRILAELGYLQLAYMTAISHGYDELAKQLQESIENPQECLDQLKKFKTEALVSPFPLILNIEDSSQAKRIWPHNCIAEEEMITTHVSSEQEKVEEIKEEANTDLIAEDETSKNIKQNQEDKSQEPTQNKKPSFDITQSEQQGALWPNEEDIIIPDQSASKSQQQKQQQEGVSSESQKGNEEANYKGENPIIRAGLESNHLADSSALGFFDNTFNYLKKQLGIHNFAPLKSIALEIFQNSVATSSCLPFQPSQINYISSGTSQRPFICKTLNDLANSVKLAYKLTTEGNFPEARNKFQQVLWTVPFLVIKENQEQDIHQLIRICLDYILALRCELEKKQNSRVLELSSYMSLFNMQVPHRILSLRQVMSISYKMKNYVYSGFFAKKLIRLMEANPNSTKPEQLQNTKKVLQSCEQFGTNESKMDFDEAWLYDDEFVVKFDAHTLSYISDAKNIIKCPFCSARYNKDRADNICDVCQIAIIGQQVLGFKK